LFFGIFIIMKSQKLVIEELSRMKSLFGYERGRVISEQVVPGTPNYGFTATTTTPAVPIPQSLPTPETPRQQNISNTFCSVKGGVIVNPSSGQNGKQWSNYVSEFTVTDAEMQAAKQKCPTSELAVALAPATAAPAAAAKVRKPDPKVMELQKQLKAAGYNLGKSGPNKDGVDGVMGPRTRAAQQQMTQQKGQDALKTMTKQGQDFQNNLNKRVQQLSALTPEQQANANALKAGQPLPQAKAPAPTTTQTVQPGTVVTQQPPTEPGQTGEFKDGWYWDEKQQQWYQP
jgi:hypothetical protein